MSNEFDAAVTTALQPDTAQSARVGFSAASDTNPDAYAEAKRVARRTGVPVDTVFAMPNEIKRQDAIGSIDFDTLAKTSPSTAALLADVEKAKVAHDDVDALSGFEQAYRLLSNSGRAVAAAIPQMNAGLWGAAAAPFELVGADGVGGFLRDQQKITQGMAKAWGPQGASSGNIESGWYSGLTSAVSNLLTLPMAFLPGGQSAALTAMVAPVFGESYGKARDKGLSPLQGINYGAADAAFEWAGERLGLGSLVKNVKVGSGFGKTLVDYLAREVPSEMATTLAQSFNEYANINPEKPVGEWVKQLPDEMAQTVVATLVGGGAITTTVKVADKAIQMMVGKQQEAQQAGQMSELLVRMNQYADASNLRMRDSETAQGFFQSILDEGRDAVYISPEALAQSGLAEQMAQSIPAVAEQLGTAAEAGHDIRIPIADLMATMAGPELEQSLLPHVAVEPGGFTQTTAQEYMQSDQAKELQAEVDRVLGEKEGDDTFKASAQAVKTTVKDQLATAGRFTESVNDAYSSMVGNFYAVQAARMGTTPEAMFERYPLRIGAESIAGQQFEQAPVVGTPDFAKWFGESQITDKKGVPLVVYHSTANAFDTFVADKRSDGFGFYFATSERKAKKAASQKGVVLPVFISANNVYGSQDAPLVNWLDMRYDGKGRQLAEQGYDAVWVKDEGGASLVVRNPTQIKSVNNRGTFDPNDANILNQKDPLDDVFRKYLLIDDSVKQGNDPVEVARLAYPEIADAVDRVVKGNSWEWAVKQAKAHFSRNAVTEARKNGIHRGTFNPATLQLTLLKNADLSTFLHESGHFFLEVQADLAGQLMQDAAIHGTDTLKPGEQQVVKDMQATLDWFGIKDLSEWNALDFEEKRSYHEKFARGFESYLFEGKAPSIELQGLFQRFRAWMMNVYRDLKALNVELTDEVRGVFDRMLATTEQITLAEQGRSMMPLFTSPEQIGMTPAEFADYQALGTDATNEAIEDLQARGLRDMQWIHNARGRVIKQLQKESAAKRAEVKMGVRAEVMSQPIYRAWQFLTGKMTADDQIDPVTPPKSDPNVLDETIDSLFAAIAKLGGINKDDVVKTWGVDSADKPTSGLFGKPLWRVEGGLSIDGMAEALSQYGYLEKDENGKWDIRELEEKFKAELGGDSQFSTAYDYAGNQPVRPGDQVANPMGLAAGRLDRASLTEIGLPVEIIEHLDKLRMVRKDGIHPDIVAECLALRPATNWCADWLQPRHRRPRSRR